MDDEQRKLITDNLPHLQKHTKCEPQFLGFLLSKKILDWTDITSINKPHSSEPDKACEFYTRILTKVDSFPVLIEGLRKYNQSEVADILEKGVKPSDRQERKRDLEFLYSGSAKRPRPRTPIPQSNIQFEIWPPVSLFTGRREELDELHRKVQRTSRSGQFTVISQLTSISGLGGIGKTQLARQYIAEHGADYDHNCIWLNADTEAGLSWSFRKLAHDKLEIPTKNADQTENRDIRVVVEEVYKFFQVSKILFVFDNAEKVTWLDKFLPLKILTTGASHPNVIIISRDRGWHKESDIEFIDIKELSVDDAVALVKKGLRLEGDPRQDDAILSLVRTLQCFPLAIQQAISYIGHQEEMDPYCVRNYLDDFGRMQRELLSHKITQLLETYTLTTFTTFKMAVNRIREHPEFGKLASYIVYAMAYLNPDRIERHHFTQLLGINSATDLKEAVCLLVKYSMVNAENNQRHLSIHRLVQEVTRIVLRDNDEEETVLRCVLCMMIGPDESWLFVNRNTDHLEIAFSHVWKYPEVTKDFSCLVPWTVGKLHADGRQQDALKFGMEAVQKLRIILSTHDHKDILTTLHMIVICLIDEGKLTEALEKNKYILERRKVQLGEAHHYTIDSQYNMSNIYIKEGRVEEGLKLFQEVCQNLETADNVEADVIVRTKVYLAWLLQSVGRNPEAVIILKKINSSLVIRSATQVQDKGFLFQFSKMQLLLADALMSEKDFRGAYEVCEKNSELFQWFPEWKGLTLWNRFRYMGDILKKMGRYEEALLKYQQCLKESTEMFENDRFRAVILSSIDRAVLLYDMKRYEEVVKELEEPLTKLESLIRTPSEVYKYIFPIFIKLLLAASLVRLQRDVEKSSKFLRELSHIAPDSHKKYVETMGPTYVFLLFDSVLNLAEYYIGKERHDEATSLLEGVDPIFELITSFAVITKFVDFKLMLIQELAREPKNCHRIFKILEKLTIKLQGQEYKQLSGLEGLMNFIASLTATLAKRISETSHSK